VSIIIEDIIVRKPRYVCSLLIYLWFGVGVLYTFKDIV